MISRIGTTGMLTITAAAIFMLATGTAFAKDDDSDSDSHRGRRGVCSSTAAVQYDACGFERKDDFYGARAICLQVPDASERSDCFKEAKVALREGRALCREQRRARLGLCAALGEGRYTPDFDPAGFDDDFRNQTKPNPYYPLTIGHVWEFQADGETNRIEVLDETKLIEGVRCIVINDEVTKEEGGGENTDDWYAQRKDGTVVYCGESVQDFEVFEGDEPQLPELTAIDGSFKAGRDGDLPGTIMLSPPTQGTTYRQEWSAGNAEDAATVLATDYGFGNDPALDEFAPQALVELLCNDDCVVTGETTPIEPDLFDYKYYAPGIGLFLEVNPSTGETNVLIGCNFDDRCKVLPKP